MSGHVEIEVYRELARMQVLPHGIDLVAEKIIRQVQDDKSISVADVVRNAVKKWPSMFR